MDRRQFVVGSAAAALAGSRAAQQEAFPSRPITIINAFPPGGINDLVGRPRRRARADLQAAGRGRDQGRRGRRGRRAGRRECQARRLHAALAQQRRFPATPRSTSCSAGSRRPRAPISFRSRGFCADPVLLLVNDQQPYKTLEEFVADAKKRPNKIVYSSAASMARAICRSRCWRRPRAFGHAPSADHRRRAGDHGGARQQRATHDADRAGHAVARQGRQAARARLVWRAALEVASRRADDEGARLRRDLLSLGRSVRPEGHAGRDRRDADRGHRQGRRQPAVQGRDRQYRPRAELSRRRRSSRNSGTRTPSAPRTTIRQIGKV